MHFAVVLGSIAASLQAFSQKADAWRRWFSAPANNKFAIKISTQPSNPMATCLKQKHFLSIMIGKTPSSLYVRILYCCALLLLPVIFHASGRAQSASQSEIQQLESRINSVQDNTQKQVQGITAMVQLATTVFAIVAGGFALLGVGTYAGLMREVRAKFSNQLDTLEKMRLDLEGRLQESDHLRQQVQSLVQIQEDLAPASILAKTRSALASEDPNLTECAINLSYLARMENVSSDELYDAALLAKEELRNDGLAKSFLRKAEVQGEGSYMIKALLAELSARDPDWSEHRRILNELLEMYPQDSKLIATAASFYITREDWNGLEETMGKSESRCPWLSSPPRNRAIAATNTQKEHGIVVNHYTRAINNCTPASDSVTYRWFADYLVNGGSPRSDNDLSQAEKLLLNLLKPNPEDGDARLELAKVKALQGDKETAIRELEIGLQFCHNHPKLREGQALLASLGSGPTSLTLDNDHEHNSRQS